MKLYTLKVFILHLSIIITYLAVTSYLFVVAKDPDPIGTGLKQWVCMILHLIITLFIMKTRWSKSSDKNLAKKKFWVNFVIIIVLIITNLQLSNFLWEWLWSIR